MLTVLRGFHPLAITRGAPILDSQLPKPSSSLSKTTQEYLGCWNYCLRQFASDLSNERPEREQRFIDKVYITAQAGQGGQGGNTLGSPTRGKQRPPSGGNGGPGGSVIVQACSKVKSLAGLNHLHRGKKGAPGKGEKTAGGRGADCVIQVPLGTIVYLRQPRAPEEFEGPLPSWITNPGKPWVGAEDYTSDDYASEEEEVEVAPHKSSDEDLKARLGEEIADLKEDKQRVTIAHGGQGGRGNAFMPKRKRRRADEDLIRRGSDGDRVNATLEMRILCDIGLVGAPNAGKSSLLRALTAASPKVASYPFTTLQPHLGTIQTQHCSLTVADIPGLIMGAAENRGLGHSFLRHISRASGLAYVVDISSGMFHGDKAPRAWDQLAWLQEELGQYNQDLLEKPALVVANKIDLLKSPWKTISALQRRTDLPVIPVSAISGNLGIEPLIQKLMELSLANSTSRSGQNGSEKQELVLDMKE